MGASRLDPKACWGVKFDPPGDDPPQWIGGGLLLVSRRCEAMECGSKAEAKAAAAELRRRRPELRRWRATAEVLSRSPRAPGVWP